jgi:hypothetical protein
MKKDNAELINNLTKRVIEAYSQIENPRTREVVVAFIKHLHNFVKEVKFTTTEFDFAWNFLAKMAHFTHDTEQKYTKENRNEFLLMSDIIGVSELIELLDYPHEPNTIEVSLLGPSGDLIRIAKRKHYRAAHLHFIISGEGYKPFVTQIFATSDVKLEDDPTFAATKDNLGNFVKDGDRYRLEVTFNLSPGSGHYPVSPMNG